MKPTAMTYPAKEYEFFYNTRTGQVSPHDPDPRSDDVGDWKRITAPSMASARAKVAGAHRSNRNAVEKRYNKQQSHRSSQCCANDEIIGGKSGVICSRCGAERGLGESSAKDIVNKLISENDDVTSMSSAVDHLEEVVQRLAGVISRKENSALYARWARQVEAMAMDLSDMVEEIENRDIRGIPWSKEY